MLAIVTTRAILPRLPVDSQVQERKSTSYLINTDCIVEMVDKTVLAVTKIEIKYKFNPYEDRSPFFVFDVDTSVSSINTQADATLQSPFIALSVFEGIESFDLVANVTASTVYFNPKDIVWGENDSTGAYSRIWVKKGGQSAKAYIVDYNINQIQDVADIGATTTSA